MPSAVCIGETMAMLTPADGRPLHQSERLLFGVGGAESNVAKGLTAWGVEAHWVGRVGTEGFGRRILDDLTAAGVGVTGVEVDPVRPTGIYVKVPAQARDERGSLSYYRQGSAAAAMGVHTLHGPAVAPLLEHASLIHLSGITPALSVGCRELVQMVLSRPRGGRRVSFDLNWRPALWAGQDPAILRRLANLADIVLLGTDEARSVFGTSDEAALRELLPQPDVLVLKNDDVSAVSLDADGRREEVPALTVEVVEPVGAGDAFAAGFLSGIVLGSDARTALRRGHLSAACTLVVRGDRGPLPPVPQLSATLAGRDRDWARTTVSAGLDDVPTLAASTR